MRDLIRALLATASRGARAQRALARIASASHYLMGLGAGASPESSGEKVLGQLLDKVATRDKRRLTVLDVGANQGQFLHLLKRHVRRANYVVHAFEPGSGAYESLRAKYAADPQVVLNKTALGECRGRGRLFLDGPRSGTASFWARDLRHRGVTMDLSEEVDIDTVDDYSTDHRVEHIDLMKLDVEGHELAVLRGCKRMLADQRIDMISFEFGGCNIDSRTYFRDFWYLLSSAGLTHIFRITPSGRLCQIRQYSERLEVFLTANYVALRDDSPGLVS